MNEDDRGGVLQFVCDESVLLVRSVIFLLCSLQQLVVFSQLISLILKFSLNLIDTRFIVPTIIQCNKPLPSTEVVMGFLLANLTLFIATCSKTWNSVFFFTRIDLSFSKKVSASVLDPDRLSRSRSASFSLFTRSIRCSLIDSRDFETCLDDYMVYLRVF